MASANQGPDGNTFQRILDQYVLAPLATAEQLVEQDRSEVTAEREAFETCHERVTEIDPVPTPTGDSHRVLRSHPEPTPMERVRTAYRDTVMDVPHYNAVYGESLVEHAAAECGRDLGVGIAPETRVSFTPAFKAGLQAAVAEAAQERRRFLATLDRESQSLATARTDLTDVLAPLASTTIPAWHREAFRNQLDEIAHERQEPRRARDLGSRVDDHTVCEYLYAEPSWTYPVLTAVTRLRDVVDC